MAAPTVRPVKSSRVTTHLAFLNRILYVFRYMEVKEGSGPVIMVAISANSMSVKFGSVRYPVTVLQPSTQVHRLSVLEMG